MDRHEAIVIVDYGSQYTQLIARRIREQRVFCTIVAPQDLSLRPELLDPSHTKGLIFSGGPASVYQPHAPLPDRRQLELGIPVLGICYGMQAIAKLLGGRVEASGTREYGRTVLTVTEPNGLFHDVKPRFTSWMSHGDSVKEPPAGFRVLAHTDNTPVAAIADPERHLYALQFHPEVAHTEEGEKILRNFLFRICGCRGDWTIQSFLEEAVATICRQVGKARVILGLSGGVDSSVAAVLLHRAIGRQLSCLFVDNGLLRRGERAQVDQTFRQHFHMDVRTVDAADQFLARLRGVEDPEEKRKRIGEAFVRVFEAEAGAMPDVEFLAQGTLYPDVIESRSAWGGPSATIKTHHNVGGLPKGMRLKLIEPLRDLFKDEVRELGKILGLPDEILFRHPFPGPGLAVRILGEVTPERLEMVREADARIVEEVQRAGLYQSLWQAFAVLLPVKTVGVMGDERTYEHAVAVRAVTSQDAMTADWAKLPPELLERMASRIISEVRGVNRVVYDISSKPPATIEWE
ncbi:MAG: glutamine-hydrolyzing GMP synthase [Candidatus Omnitrophota bacterium]|nr:glutamine-hydrolyzing GMP synthase [Candidatus Omnitrophota bacterium]